MSGWGCRGKARGIGFAFLLAGRYGGMKIPERDWKVFRRLQATARRYRTATFLSILA